MLNNAICDVCHFHLLKKSLKRKRKNTVEQSASNEKKLRTHACFWVLRFRSICFFCWISVVLLLLGKFRDLLVCVNFLWNACAQSMHPYTWNKHLAALLTHIVSWMYILFYFYIFRFWDSMVYFFYYQALIYMYIYGYCYCLALLLF